MDEPEPPEAETVVEAVVWELAAALVLRLVGEAFALTVVTRVMLTETVPVVATEPSESVTRHCAEPVRVVPAAIVVVENAVEAALAESIVIPEPPLTQLQA